MTVYRPLRRLALLFLPLALYASVVAPPAAAAVGTPVTYQDHTYGTDVVSPSADKPQSKLWYAQGAWWSLMVPAGGTTVTIHELLANHTWRNTGVLVDDRLNSTGDALFSRANGKLYVVSRHATTAARVLRFSYVSSQRTWTRDAGFPVTLATGGGSESATIDRDTTGRLWVTYTRSSRIWVAFSAVGDDTNWSTPTSPSVPDTTVYGDDISALIAFDGKIGVLWSDQGTGTFWFATHRDGAPVNEWTVEEALQGTNLADDHINLKGLSSDSQGRIFAAFKTSNDTAGADALLVGVLVRTPRADGTGAWKVVPAGTVADDHSRPIIMIDATNQELYFFATAPVSGGVIYYKKTSLANPSFGPGRGTPFLAASGKTINNATAAKDPVTSASGLVIFAAAHSTRTYYHAEMELAGGTGTGDTTAPSAPTGLNASATGPRSVALSWSASSDNVGVTGYTVLRNGQAIGSASGTTYTDTTAAPSTSYTYTVRASDAAGNVSAASAPESVQTPADNTPGGTISFVAATEAQNTATTTVSVPVPSGVVAKDLLVASIDVRGQPTITAPTGWTLARRDSGTTTMQKATYWRVATASEVTPTWRFSSAQSAVASMLVYRGVRTTTPIEASAGRVDLSTRLVTAPSVTAVSDNAMVVGLFGVPTRSTFTPPAGTRERTDLAISTSVTYGVAGASVDKVQSQAGATGNLTATASLSGSKAIGQTLVLAPAG